jgi:hypothetical protein
MSLHLAVAARPVAPHTPTAVSLAPTSIEALARDNEPRSGECTTES